MPATWQITHSEECHLSKESFTVHLYYQGHGVDILPSLEVLLDIFLIMNKMLVMEPSHHYI